MSIKASRPKVLLVASKGEWSGLVRLPYMVRRCNADLSILTTADSALRRSWHVHSIHTLPDSLDALVPTLREHLAHHHYDMVVLGDDPAFVSVAEAAAKETDASWIDGWFPVERKVGLEPTYSKTAFNEACDQAGLPIPRSHVCNTFDETTAAALEVGYPLVLKTAVGLGGNGVIKVNRPADLRAAFEKLKQRTPLVVQEFIVGKLGTTQLVLDQGKVLYWLPSYVLKCCPEPFGPSCVRQFFEQPDLDLMEPIVRGVAKMTNFRGMCGIDWIQRDDGSFAILEFNPRPTPAMEMGRFAGADSAMALKSLLTGEPVAESPKVVTGRRRTVYMFPQHMVRSLRYREYGEFRHWIPFMATHEIPWCEPMLLAASAWQVLKIARRHLAKALLPWGNRSASPFPPIRNVPARPSQFVMRHT